MIVRELLISKYQSLQEDEEKIIDHIRAKTIEGASADEMYDESLSKF